jgi:hypothetical protein
VISELARRGLTPGAVEADGPYPVIRVPAGTPPITPEMVRRALDEDRAHDGLDGCQRRERMGDVPGHGKRFRSRFLEPEGPAQPDQRRGSAPGPCGTSSPRGTHLLARRGSACDQDMPEIHGYRQVTDAHLLTLARRHRVRLVTFDTAVATLLDGSGVELLTVM